MASEDIQQLLRTGIEAAQSGNKAIARHILEQVIDQDPQNELAWIWLASVVSTVDERRNCLQKVLEVNPKNERAKQALTQLQRATPAVKAAPKPDSPPLDQPPPSPTSRTRADRVAELERDAILRVQARRQRQHSPWFFIGVGLLAVTMIATGLVLLWQNLQSEEPETALPTATAISAAATPTRSSQPSGFVTPTPIGGVLITLPPKQTLPATWTPTATWTPLPSPTATVTPASLASYTLLVSQRTSGQWELVTIKGDGSNARQVTLRASSSDTTDITLLEVFDGAFSPDGQQIAFTARVSDARAGDDGTPSVIEYEDVFAAPAQGGLVRRLTMFEANAVEDVTWSPDGKEIAFASDADGDYDIYIVSIEGGAPRPLTRNTGEDRDPAWSPDGKYIAFASDRSGPGFLEVWRIAPNGADLKQLTDNVNSSYAPAWSPDSAEIVFLSNRRVNTDLYIMDAEGNGERAVIVRDVDAEERDPAWSPDGRWIVFSSNREEAVFELYLIQPDGSELQRITFESGEIRYAVWQP